MTSDAVYRIERRFTDDYRGYIPQRFERNVWHPVTAAVGRTKLYDKESVAKAQLTQHIKYNRSDAVEYRMVKLEGEWR